MKDSQTPKVSILLAAYNGENYIGEAIKSVIAQSYKNFELIISDDGSTDTTKNICAEYSHCDNRIKYIRHQINRGGFWNNNFLLTQATGSLITFLSQDDILEFDFVEKTASYIKNHPECVLVSGDFKLIDEDGLLIRTENLTLLRDTIPWRRRIVEFFRYRGPQVSLCLYGLFKADILKDLYSKIKFSKKIVRGSDFFLLSPTATRGEITSIPFSIRKYRLHENSASHKEMAQRNKQGEIKRRFLLLASVYIVRIEQLRVLLKSGLPVSLKFEILITVLKIYVKEFMTRIKSFLIKRLSLG